MNDPRGTDAFVVYLNPRELSGLLVLLSQQSPEPESTLNDIYSRVKESEDRGPVKYVRTGLDFDRNLATKMEALVDTSWSKPMFDEKSVELIASWAYGQGRAVQEQLDKDFAEAQQRRAQPYVTPEDLADTAPPEEIKRRINLAKAELARMARKSAKPEHATCSFCGKGRTEVKCLISGNSHFICDECTQLTAELLFEQDPPIIIAVRDAKLPKPPKAGDPASEDTLVLTLNNLVNVWGSPPHDGKGSEIVAASRDVAQAFARNCLTLADGTCGSPRLCMHSRNSVQVSDWPCFTPHPQDNTICYICGQTENFHGTAQNHCHPFVIPEKPLTPCVFCNNGALAMEQDGIKVHSVSSMSGNLFAPPPTLWVTCTAQNMENGETPPELRMKYQKMRDWGSKMARQRDDQFSGLMKLIEELKLGDFDQPEEGYALLRAEILKLRGSGSEGFQGVDRTQDRGGGVQERCFGGCSRGGEGPACGKLGCQG
jgi:hypothetical protein